MGNEARALGTCAFPRLEDGSENLRQCHDQICQWLVNERSFADVVSIDVWKATRICYSKFFQDFGFLRSVKMLNLFDMFECYL